jgi:hypothetical protein
MDKKTFTLGILSLTAVLLFVANVIIPPREASANFAVKDRDYQVVTAAIQANDEALYILDNRSGMMACFSYNPGQKALTLRDLKPITNAFPNAR